MGCRRAYSTEHELHLHEVICRKGKSMCCILNELFDRFCGVSVIMKVQQTVAVIPPQSFKTSSLKLRWFVMSCKWSLVFLNAFDLWHASKERDSPCVLCNLFSSAADWMNDYKYRALVECQNIKVLKILKFTGYIIYCPFNCNAWYLLLQNLIQLCRECWNI